MFLSIDRMFCAKSSESIFKRLTRQQFVGASCKIFPHPPAWYKPDTVVNGKRGRKSRLKLHLQIFLITNFSSQCLSFQT